jgi:D-amino-acid dehydrogenase
LKIVVLGGGVTGMFLSYYLTKDGHAVTLIDTPLDGARTSKYNSGEITPSGVPVPTIGMGLILSRYFGRMGPVYVSPSVFLKNQRWFGIARKKMLGGYEEQIMGLASKSLEIYEEFFKEVDMQVDRVDGITALFAEDSQVQEYAKKWGGQIIDQSEAYNMGYTGFAGGVRFAEEFSIHPGKLFDGLRKKLTEMGVQMILDKPADLKKDNGSVKCVVSGVGEVAGDNYVIAAGAWSKKVCASLGYDPLIIPARGLVMLFDTGGTRIVKQTAMIEGNGISVSQHNQNLLRVASYFEIVGFKQSFDEARKNWVMGRVRPHLVGFDKLKLTKIEDGMGYRPCTPDQYPVIGKLPGYQNVFIASGNCRLGLTLAPATALVLRSIIKGEEPKQIDSKYIDPSRFIS